MRASVPDRIEVTGIAATGRHGVFDHERRDGQPFLVDLAVELDMAQAGHRDDLALTVDYGGLADLVVRRVAGESVALIETLAQDIATEVLLDERIDAVEVTVHKPQAPIGHPVADVRVRVRRERGIPVVVAVGGNAGDRCETLTRAVDDLARLPGLAVTAVSPLVESDPVGGPEQPRYLNAVVLARTTRSPRHLLSGLHDIEARYGRVREVRWGARTVDLDLVQYGVPGSPGEHLSDDDVLTLPHPRSWQRAFVLVPWEAVDPDATLRLGSRLSDPVRTVAELAAEVGRTGVDAGPDWGQQW